MAAPGFITPQRRAGSRPVRRFTLDLANRSLPLVKRIVSDIVRVHGLASSYRQSLEQTTGAKELATLQTELDRAVARQDELLDELSNVGVELKDFEVGLVDFIGRHDGRDVCLCWKLGEEQITHWHELNAGFAGRKPVSLLREREKEKA
jgi:hypothetical protein